MLDRNRLIGCGARAAILGFALLLSACAVPSMRESRSPPAVSVPEPGSGARASQPSTANVPRSAPASGARAHAAPDGGALSSDGGIGSPGTPDYSPAASSNNAVNTLLAQADQSRQSGDIESAIASAERALRIAPADPAVYCQLAELRVQHGDYALAEQLARKGLSYRPDPDLRLRLEGVVERARRGMTG